MKSFIEVHLLNSDEPITLNTMWIDYIKRDGNGRAIMTVKGRYSDFVTEETYEKVVEELT